MYGCILILSMRERDTWTHTDTRLVIFKVNVKANWEEAEKGGGVGERTGAELESEQEQEKKLKERNKLT